MLKQLAFSFLTAQTFFFQITFYKNFDHFFKLQNQVRPAVFATTMRNIFIQKNELKASTEDIILKNFVTKT